MNKSPNHLINEKSPYLLQHAYNPVDWFPWGKEAFEKARKEDKPVFLSIGYSSCHWCHVMEHESFEDKKISELLNEVFISIKVDREERPDIDQVYMTVCQMLTGSGGWPMTIIMTPDKKPFFAGTYIPNANRPVPLGFGKMGMVELIGRIKELWNSNRGEILKSAEEISSSLKMTTSTRASSEITESIFTIAYDDFVHRFDSEFGGFGSAPKFPTPHNILFLLKYWRREKKNEALNMAEKTLYEMRNGGIFDQIGFGFHRYSTDREWLVPHFEKMLYDQALLTTAYIEAYRATKNPFYSNTVEEIITYVLRDMTSAEGGFYSAEDADSEGKEGKFYLWKEEEIKSILAVPLGKEDAGLIIKIFGINSEGNWIDYAHNAANRTNILHLKKSIAELSVELEMSQDELIMNIDSARGILFAHRNKRVHPFKDDKILTDWNGLMISALAKASISLDNSNYRDSAEKAMKFILEKLKDENGRILHMYRDGQAKVPANIDDYSFTIAALLDLYEATFNTGYLKKALLLCEESIKYLWDTKDGGFFFTSHDSEELLIRPKEIYDGAVPSGNSVAILNLIKLARITGNQEYESKAFKISKVFSKNINVSPSAFSEALAALDFAFGPSFEIVVSGDLESDTTTEMLKVINEYYIPNKIVILNRSDDEVIKSISPFVVNQGSIEGKPTVYVCTNHVCNLPVTTKSGLEKILNEI